MTAEKTQFHQHLNKESTARSRENKTAEGTQLQQQTDREETRRSRTNESSKITTIRSQSEQQRHCNRNEAIQRQNVFNISDKHLSNQFTTNNNDDSELIK